VYNLKPRQIFDRAFHTVIVGDRVYFGSSATDKVHCLDAKTGVELWSFFSDGPVRLAPTVVGDLLYFGSDDGCIYCLKADSGDLVWKQRAVPQDRRVPGNGRMISLWPVRTSLIVQDNLVYTSAGMFPSEGVHLLALDAATGEERWRQLQTDLPAQGYLLASRTRLYVPAGRNNPAVCDIADGKRLRVVEGAGGTYALLTDDMLVFGPGKTGQLGVVEDGRADQLATFQGNHMIVAPTHSYLHSDTELSALDRLRYLELSRERKRLSTQQSALAKQMRELAKDPEAVDRMDAVKEQLAQLGKDLDAATQGMEDCIVWRQACSWPDSLVLAGSTLVAGGEDEIAAFDIGTGKLQWKHPVHGRAYGIAISNGNLFISTDTGTIHCFRNPTREARQIPAPDPATQIQRDSHASIGLDSHPDTAHSSQQNADGEPPVFPTFSATLR